MLHREMDIIMEQDPALASEQIPVVTRMMMASTSGSGSVPDDDGESRIPVPHLELVPVPVEVRDFEGPSAGTGTGGESNGFLLLTSSDRVNEGLAREVFGVGDGAASENTGGDADKPGGDYMMSGGDLIIDTRNASGHVPKATCSNCSSSVVSSSSSSDVSNSTRKLHEFVNCSIFDRRKRTVEQKDIKILEMLTNLYVLKKNKGKILSGELLMCGNCVGRLSQLFQLFHEFLSLSVMSGAVMSKLIGIGKPTPQGKVVPKKGLSRSPVKSRKVLTLNEGRQSSRMMATSPVSKIGKTAETNNKNTSLKEIKAHSICLDGKQLTTEDTSSEVNVERIAIKSEHYTKDEGASGLPSLQFVRVDKPMTLRSESKSRTDDKGDSTQQFESTTDSKNDCKRCGKSFKSFVGLKVHYASHLRDDDKFVCKECGKKFRKQDALDEHTKVDHEGFKPHKCSFEGCGRSFRLKDKLKLHIQVMHEKRKPFPCPKCEKSFRTKYHLKIHDVSQHIQGDNLIGCSQCKRKFPSRETLDTHVVTHEEVKPFVCNVCQKGFHTISRLKLHLKSHDVIPSCICSVCGKAYKHVRDLRLHEIVHQDESTYRFACGDCPKKFYRIDLLRVHQANEQHFSTETVGPSISKLVSPRSTKKSKLKRKKYDSINDDDLNDEEAQLFDELESQSLEPRDSGKQGNKNSSTSKKKVAIRHSNSIQNQESSSIKLISSPIDQPPENVLQGSVLTQDYAGMDKASEVSTSTATKKETSLQETTSQLNTSAHQSFQLPLTTHTLYPLKDASDPALPSFCISAGAEQIGFDVISAYINNLNS